MGMGICPGGPYAICPGASEEACAAVTDFEYVMEVAGAEPRRLIIGDPRFSRSKHNFAYRVNESGERRRRNVKIDNARRWAKRLSPMCLVTTRQVMPGEELLTHYGAGPWVFPESAG